MGKICLRSRRGMRELDDMLAPFIAGIDQNDEVLLKQLDVLLSQEDTHLLDWFLGRETPENPDLQMIVEQIRKA